MTHSQAGKGDGRTVTIKIPQDTYDYLAEVAYESGMKVSRLVGAVMIELAPRLEKVQTVQRTSLKLKRGEVANDATG